MGRTLSQPESLEEIEVGPGGAQVGAFFDLDGTLVDGFTATAHAGHRIRRRQAAIGEIFGILEASVRYRIGRMPFERLLVRAAGYLRGESLPELDELGEYLFENRIAGRVYPHMRDVVRRHQDSGHTVVLSSSALTIHAEPVARNLGINHVLCNHFQTDAQGRLTGGIVEPIIWGERKAAAVQDFCRENRIELGNSYFYADGAEDGALMRLVGHPRPVNPRPGMVAAATDQGWPVLTVPRPGGRRRLRPGAR
ncbi:HAD superfamily hydrolase (TIGR01490 family) [Mycobacterium frederiksbergense]|uniref:HAD superfamily hydrolase (TIGR01490 family) n=1 Tax=Mycolicibacterium frederiksbergense TaxID=117567 RepID=A0ABT6KU25_9MYCO|nr:HAD-IB family hydrolase [Mycolicibacterium frederiksbergense]MDH6194220.1 HAD superfamily hydrolase (TIGR01490 family) [Mycolicibacterium frederiksbergense]